MGAKHPSWLPGVICATHYALYNDGCAAPIMVT